MINISTIIDNDVLTPFKQLSKDQLNSSYIFPKVQPLMFNNSAWCTRLLCQSQELLVTVTFRPHLDAMNPDAKTILSQLYLTESNTQSLMLQIVSEGVPVFGSYSKECNILAIVFQYEYQQQLKYDAAIFYCGDSKNQIVYKRNESKQQYLTIMKNSNHPIQLHVLDKSSNNTNSQNVKTVKILKNELFGKYKDTLRLLLLVANTHIEEINVDFELYKLLSNKYTQDEQKEFQQSCLLKFGVQLQKIQSFIVFQEHKVISTHAQNQDQQNSMQLLVYMQYEQHSQDLVFAFKINKNNVFLKIFLLKLSKTYAHNEQCFKLLSQFNTAALSQLHKLKILPFSDYLLQNDTCRISYKVNSAMNNVINLEMLFSDDSKIYLICFHIPTGSVIKLQCESGLNLVNSDSMSFQNTQETLNFNLYASKILKFLQKCQQLKDLPLSEERDNFNMYRFLAYKKNFDMFQPIILSFIYFQLWFVVDVIKQKINIHFIKILPFTPIECIFTQIMPLNKINYYQRFTDFLNGDKEFFKDDNTDVSIYDFNFQFFCDQDLCMNLSKEVVKQNIDIINIQPKTVKTLDSDYDTVEASETKNNYFICEGTDEDNILLTNVDITTAELSNGEQSCVTTPAIYTQQLSPAINQQMSPSFSTIQQTFESNILTDDCSNSNTQNKQLFVDNLSIPLFTQNEVAFFYNIQHCFSQYTIRSSQNYMVQQPRIRQLLQPFNNTFYQLEFAKQMSKILKTYDSNKLKDQYDVSQYTIIISLFTNQYFDSLDCQLKQITINSKDIINLLMDNICTVSQTILQHQNFYQLINDQQALNQKYLSKFLHFLTDMLQQCAQLYQMQLNEFINILKAIISKEFFEIVNKYNSNQQMNKLLTTQPLMDYFLQKMIQKSQCFRQEHNYQIQINLKVDLLYSIIRFSQTILRTLQNSDKMTQYITNQQIEFFIADYIYNRQILNDIHYQKFQIIRLISLEIFVDFNDKKMYHPLAKQYLYNQYCIQTLYKQFLESDDLFLKCLQSQDQQNIATLNSSYQELQYFRLFDKSLKDVNTIVQVLQNNKKVSSTEHTDSIPLGKIIFNLGFILNQLQKTILNNMYDQTKYHLILNNENDTFTNKTQAVLELFEFMNVKVVNQLLNYSSINNFITKRPPEVPIWLNHMILQEFNETNTYLAPQSQYYFSDISVDCNDIAQIINTNSKMQANKQSIVSSREFYYLQSSSIPYTVNNKVIENQIDRILNCENRTKHTRDSSSTNSYNKNDTQLVQFQRKASVQITSYLGNNTNSQVQIGTHSAPVNEPQYHINNLKLQKKIKFKQQNTTTNIQFLFQLQKYEILLRQQQMLYKSASNQQLYTKLQQCTEVQLMRQVHENKNHDNQIYAPLYSPVSKKRLQQLFHQPISTFNNGHQTVNRNKLYVDLTTRKLLAYCQSLDVVKLYTIEFTGKRSLKTYGMISQHRDFDTGELISILLE